MERSDMVALARQLASISCNRGGQLIWCDDRERGIARDAVSDQRAALGRADGGQRSGCRMRAALGAAGNVNRERPAEELRRFSRDARRNRAGGNMCGRADRRAGTSDDKPARIVATHDEPQALGCGDESVRCLACEVDHDERAPGAARIPAAPAAPAASTKRSIADASAWPKARPIP